MVNFPLPSVHMLVPCSDHKFIADRSFRRALQYAINREDILNGELLQNRTIPGCRVVSGPFPAGLDVSDPLDMPTTKRSRLAPISRKSLRC